MLAARHDEDDDDDISVSKQMIMIKDNMQIISIRSEYLIPSYSVQTNA